MFAICKSSCSFFPIISLTFVCTDFAQITVKYIPSSVHVHDSKTFCKHSQRYQLTYIHQRNNQTTQEPTIRGPQTDSDTDNHRNWTQKQETISRQALLSPVPLQVSPAFPPPSPSKHKNRMNQFTQTFAKRLHWLKCRRNQSAGLGFKPRAQKEMEDMLFLCLICEPCVEQDSWWKWTREWRRCRVCGHFPPPEPILVSEITKVSAVSFISVTDQWAERSVSASLDFWTLSGRQDMTWCVVYKE